MATVNSLLNEIAAFCEEFKIPESTFGRRVMSDGKFVERIRQGGGLTVANLDRINAYMADERQKVGAKAPAEARSRKRSEQPPPRRKAA